MCAPVWAILDRTKMGERKKEEESSSPPPQNERIFILPLLQPDISMRLLCYHNLFSAVLENLEPSSPPPLKLLLPASFQDLRESFLPFLSF